VEVEDALRELEGAKNKREGDADNMAAEAVHHDPVEVWGLNQKRFQTEGMASTYEGGKGVRHPQAVEPGDIAIESQDSILWRLVPFWARHSLQRVFTPAVVVAANHAAWFTMFAVAFSYPNWFLIPLFNIFSIVFTKSLELIPKYQAISSRGVAYYEPTMAYLQAHGAGALDPQYIDLRDYRNRETQEIYRHDMRDPTIIDDDIEDDDDTTNVIPDDRDLLTDKENPWKKH